MAAEESLKAPPISQELIDWLRWIYPLRPPDEHMDDRRIWINAGHQYLILKLVSERNKQIGGSD